MIFKRSAGRASTLALLLSTAAAVSSSPALGQTVPPESVDQAIKDTQATASAKKVTKKPDDAAQPQIVVTGSRILRKVTDSPAPVAVVTSEQIRAAGTQEVADVVNELPSISITQTNQTSNLAGNAGVNALDLRGLGTQRTLVLVDGRRQVPVIAGTSAVDVSTIPSALVDHIEVLTGGASAMYGADAVSGVVNFILKRNFQGIDASAQYGNSDRWDMPTYDLDVLGGTNFNHDRGNVTLFAYRGAQLGNVTGEDRPWTAGGYPFYARATTNEPFSIVDNQRSIYSANTAQVLLGGKLWTFDQNGALAQPVLGPGGITNLAPVNLNNPANVGTLVTNGGDYGGRYDSWYLVVPSKRTALRGSLDYEFSDALKFSGSVQYSHNTSRAQYAAWNEYGQNAVPTDSPFITDQMRQANGGSITAPLNFARRFPELGLARTEYDRSMLQANVGIHGEYDIFSKPWNYSVYYAYGDTHEKTRDVNATASNRYLQAIDSTVGPDGQPICRSTLTDPADGCVPLNPFMPLQAREIAYLQYTSDWSHSTLQQQVASGYTGGELFDLPGGPAQLVLGAEYRKEKNNIGVIPQYNPDSPLFDPSIGTTASPLVGSYTVREEFSEVSLPLVKNLPLLHTLSLDGAVRFSHYSTAGNTTTWKLGGLWSPIRDIRFRGTYGKAVRAPNIGEIFTASNISGMWLSDPCNYYNVKYRADMSQYAAANCAAIKPSNYNTYWLWLQTNTQGNPALKPEVAKTLTLGVVLQPRFIKNLTLTADYYNIDLRGAIDTFPAQTVIDRCVDAPSLNNIFCGLVQRDANHNLTGVLLEKVNIARYLTRGIDYELLYRLDLSQFAGGRKIGKIDVDAAFTRLLRRNYTLDPANPDTVTKFAGTFGSPKWKGVVRTTYDGGTFGLTWTLRYFSPMRPGSTYTAENYTKIWTPVVVYNDFSGWARLRPNLDFFAGMRNAFDRAPPRIPGAEAGGANFELGYQAGVYDVIGRTFYAGVRFHR